MKEVNYDAEGEGGYPLAQERVAVGKGAALLDKLLPGWHNEVVLDQLDMGSGAMCMMGQLFGTGVESKLADEMYPKEMRKAKNAYCSGWWMVEMGDNIDGFEIAETYNPPRTSFIAKLMRKIGMQFTDPKTKAKFMALRHVCSGHDNSCLWAEEVAERRAKEKGTKRGKKAKA